MKLIDEEKLLDTLIQLPPSPCKENLIHYISLQPEIEAIPIEFIRQIIEACEDEGYKGKQFGIKFLLKQWREETERKIHLW